jgi:hypothetical protein
MSRPSEKSSKPAKCPTRKQSPKKPSGFHIAIRHQQWRVRFCKVPQELWENPEEPEYGKCIHKRRLILVDPEWDNPFWTLFHEISHATLPDNDEHSIINLELNTKKLTDRYPGLKIL